MSKVNTSGADVHISTLDPNGPRNHVVHPGGEFPDGEYLESLDPTLYADVEDAEEVPAAGPGQRPEDLARTPASSASVEPWKAVTVPTLQEGLAKHDPPIEYSADDRKDALIEKAEAAGLSPADFGAGD